MVESQKKLRLWIPVGWAAAIVVVVLVGWRVWSAGSTGSTPQPAANAGDYEISDPTRFASKLDEQELIAGIGDAFTASDVAGLSREDKEDLSSQAGELLNLYRQGSVDSFAAWLSEQGVSPAIWADADKAQDLWRRSTIPMRDAPVDVDEVEVIQEVVNGEPRPRKMESNAYRGFLNPSTEGYIDPVAQGTDSIEIIVPAILKTKYGDSFTGKIGMIFAKRPSDGRWIIIGSALYDTPGGVGFKAPPP